MIRVNSQSGKGGVAYILKAEHKLDLPRRAQIEFSRVVQERTDAEGGEMAPDDDLGGLPPRVPRPRDPAASSTRCTPRRPRGRRTQLTVNVYVDGELRDADGRGQRPDRGVRRTRSTSLPRPGSFDVRVLDYAEHALSAGGDAIAAAYVECAVGDQVLWGVGLDANIVTASLKAVISAVNRA